MCDLPIEIPNYEIIVRAVMCPSHVKPNRLALKPAAFKSKPGTDDVSVIRHTHMGSDFCKQKAKQIANEKAEYAGLAWISAKDIREATSQVTDSRSEYCGHAHIEHGLIFPAGEPPEGATFDAITERCKELVKRAKYLPDPQPAEECWTGAAIGN